MDFIDFAFQKAGKVISILAINSSDQGNSTHDTNPLCKHFDGSKKGWIFRQHLQV
jgi:hypothetical protein